MANFGRLISSNVKIFFIRLVIFVLVFIQLGRIVVSLYSLLVLLMRLFLFLFSSCFRLIIFVLVLVQCVIHLECA